MRQVINNIAKRYCRLQVLCKYI